MWFTLNCCKVKMKIPNSQQKKQFKKLCIFISIFSIHHDSDSAWSYVKNVCILNCTIIIYNGSGGLVLHSYYTGFLFLSLYELITCYQSDGLWKQTVLVSGCFGIQCSIAPTRGEWLEQVGSRVVVCTKLHSGLWTCISPEFAPVIFSALATLERKTAHLTASTLHKDGAQTLEPKRTLFHKRNIKINDLSQSGFSFRFFLALIHSSGPTLAL